jgi:hypothetical protein
VPLDVGIKEQRKSVDDGGVKAATVPETRVPVAADAAAAAAAGNESSTESAVGALTDGDGDATHEEEGCEETDEYDRHGRADFEFGRHVNGHRRRRRPSLDLGGRI